MSGSVQFRPNESTAPTAPPRGPGSTASQQPQGPQESAQVHGYQRAGDLHSDPARHPSDPRSSRGVTQTQSAAARGVTGGPVNPYKPEADVKTLRNAMEGMGTDEEAVLNVLEGKNPLERKRLTEAYERATGRKLEADLRDELGGEDLRTAEAYLKQGRLTEADRLFEAMTGAGTDEATVMRMLEGRKPEEIQAIRDEYRQKFNSDLDQDLSSELSGDDWKKAQVLLRGVPTENPAIQDPAARRADLLRQTGDQGATLLENAMKGAGTDERTILDTLHGKSPEERQAIQDAYKQRTGRELSTDLGDELSGSDLKMAKSYLESGRESAADKLFRAVDGAGTDETLILRTLEEVKPEERQALMEEYENKHGEKLADRLTSELSGADRVKALALLEKGEIGTRDQLEAAMAGAGTDEQGIFDALQSAKPEERAALQKDPAFMERLDSELSGEDKARAYELLGKGKLDTAGKLNVAMAGAGTDEQALFDALEGATPDERRRLQEDPAFRERLRGELSGEDLERAEKLLQQGRVSARDGVRYATSGAGTDEAGVFKALEGASAEERQQLQDDPEFRELLRSELSGTDLEKAEKILQDGPLTVRDRVRFASDGAGTDEKAIFEALKSATPEERAELMKDEQFRETLRSELGGADLDRAEILLERGETSRVEDLRLAMQGAGTDEKAIFDVLGGLRDDADRQKIVQEYRDRYGRDLLADLEGDLGSADFRRAEGALRTAPQTPQEVFDRVTDDMLRDREGGGWTGVSSSFVDAFSDRGRDLDDQAREIRGTFHGARHEGTLDQPETMGRLTEQHQSFEVKREDYHAAKEAVADNASTVLSITAATAIAAVTAGTGAPLSAVILGGALGLGSGKVVLNKAILGQDYDMLGADGARDFAVGAAEGAAVAVSSPLGKALIPQKTFMGAVGRGAISGATTGGTGGFMKSATDDQTWDDGFAAGVAKVGQKAATDLAVGAAVGGAVDGAWSLGPGRVLDGMKNAQAVEEGLELGAVRRATRAVSNAIGEQGDAVKKAATGLPKDELKHEVKGDERPLDRAE